MTKPPLPQPGEANWGAKLNTVIDRKADLDDSGRLAVDQGPDLSGLDAGGVTRLYVHPSVGSDTNSGRVASAPKATVASAMSALPSAGGVIQLATAGTYPLSSGITLDNARHSIVGVPGAVLDFSAMSGSGTAITVLSTANIGTTFSPNGPLENVELVGPGSSTSSVGILWESTSYTNSVAHQSPRNVEVHGFGTGMKFGNFAYMFSFVNAIIWGNGVGVWAPSGVSFAGERLAFFGGVIQNNVTLNVLAENPNGELMLEGVSIVYPVSGRMVEVNGTCHVYLTDCHLEDNTTNTGVCLKTTAGGVIHMQGGSLSLNGFPADVTTRTAIIQNDCSYDQGGVRIDGAFLYNLNTASGYIGTGTGRTLITNSHTNDVCNVGQAVSATMNLLADGTMESTTVDDSWFVTADTAAITNRLTGANLVLSKSTTAAHGGTRALQITKSGGSGTAAHCALVVPIQRGVKPLYRLWYSKPGSGMVGTAYVALYAAAVLPSGVTYSLLKSSTIKVTGVTMTNSALAWTQFALPSTLKTLPAWATHLYLDLNLDNVTAGSFYVDDVELTSI